MSDGIQWLAEGGRRLTGVLFARGIPPEELARRMGADPARAARPISGAEVWDLDAEVYRPGADGDGVIRVGESGGWSFAIEYGDSTGGDLLTEIARDGVEVVHFRPMAEHAPALLDYARDGAVLCGFGLAEERWRWGREPDLLLPDLVAAGVLKPDGVTRVAPDGEPRAAADRRTLGAVERRFGLTLPPAVLDGIRLRTYAVRGTPDLDAWKGLG
ncbi:DUF6461 domain-containing protein [Kitasatospora aureofaciens]|uniref:DUF6461 domain-containing protein n=1 Tax=Kitasatospora aureofaciens TaxID=1894 RepID=UPI001C47C4EE|nr:DUF6461 domain-containing protein [Kitasatospora aureofaciens]MBV6700465.1 hypothetical protein [Kitasatospora aureofaciens]